MKREWCRTERTHLGLANYSVIENGVYTKKVKKPERRRCPDCKKRFMTFIQECHDPGCFHEYFPPHKR